MTAQDGNSNTSATGGYLLPAVPCGLPGGLTLEEFIQTVLVGVSGLPADLVRPKYQINPPKQPDIGTNWLAYGILEDDADPFAYNDIRPDQSNVFQRMENLPVGCSFYGTHALEYAKLLRDGFQIGQNREALQAAKMDFVSTSKATRAPDIVNERWLDRWEMVVNLRAEIIRTYPILTFLSFNGQLDVLQSGGVKTIALNAEG